MNIEVSIPEGIRRFIAPRIPNFKHAVEIPEDKKIRDLLTKGDIMSDLMGEEPDAPLGKLLHRVFRKSEAVEKGRNRFATGVYMAVYKRFVGSSSIEGLENLQEARERAKNEGKRIIFTPRHEADFDNPTLRYILRARGYSDILDNTLWVAGVNMRKRLFFRMFMRAEHVVYIATPADLADIDKALEREDLDENMKAKLEKTKETFRRINGIAAKKIGASEERGENLVLYPEAGRSYDGLLKQAPRQVGVYIPTEDSAIILPLRMFGSKKINPPNKVINLSKLIHRQHVSMVVGDPYPSIEAWRWKKVREQQLRAQHDGVGRVRVNPADWLMVNIANVSPEDIRPEEFSYYQEQLEAVNGKDGFRFRKNNFTKASQILEPAARLLN